MSSATTHNNAFLAELARLVGSSHLLTDPAKTQRYRKGFRSGQGEALAVVFPGTLLELWRVLNACVNADKIILMQAANTGLTEGSTPNGNDYDRDIVIISTLRLDKLHLLDKGEQVLAYPGTTLYSLEKELKPLGREPHSVIGSSCIGASVVGGISNNSGGSLVQRGPAYTEMSLYAQIDENGKLTLVNHLGIDLGTTPEQILSRLDDERVKDEDVRHDGRHAHDHDYVTRVRDVNADTPARYNADPDRLFESSGCAGKLAVFAVRLDTFPAEKRQQVFYIGTNRPEVLTEIRRHILAEFSHLPVAGEYMHRDIYDIAERALHNQGVAPVAHLITNAAQLARSISKTGFGQLNIPVITIDQMIGVTERQRVGGMGESRHIFLRGAQLANQRILLAGDQQLSQIARGGNVMNRQASGLNVTGAGHSQRLRFGVHRANKGVIAAGIMVRQAGSGAVFRRHERQQQHIAAADLAVQANA